HAAVNEVGGGAGYSKILPLIGIFIHRRFMFLTRKTFGEFLFIQFQFFGIARQIGLLKGILVVKKHVMIRPKLLLLIGASCRQSCWLGLFMKRQRVVLEIVAHLLLIL